MLPTWDHMGPREHPIRIKANVQQLFTRQLGSLLRFNNLYLKKKMIQRTVQGGMQKIRTISRTGSWNYFIESKNIQYV